MTDKGGNSRKRFAHHFESEITVVGGSPCKEVVTVFLKGRQQGSHRTIGESVKQKHKVRKGREEGEGRRGKGEGTRTGRYTQAECYAMSAASLK